MYKHRAFKHSQLRKSGCQRVRHPTAQNTARSYQIAPASNRLLGFTQTLSSGTATTGASASVLYSLDANGSMLKDGLRTYEFDAANRLANATTGTGPNAPTTRYVHNALGQRLFKTEPLFPPVASGANLSDPAVALILANFAASLWGGSTTVAAPTAAEKLGYQYYYDEDGSLLSEIGAGGTQSTGSTQYIYLPTPSGPMPIALLVNATQYAVHTDHLNTPRRLTLANRTVAWQWAFSAFGDEQPTTAKNRFVDLTTSASLGTSNVADVAFNLRYPGQYFDKESGLNYNYFRSYDAKTGRYTQSDPIDLAGGWNKFGYVNQNPLSFTDPLGLCIGPLIAPCAWLAVNAPWVLSGAGAATTLGYGYVNGLAGPASNAATAGRVVEQYALRANESGFYPVMTRGFKDATAIQWCDKGDVWKFGTTVNPLSRYSQSYLDNIGPRGVTYFGEFGGTSAEALALEAMKIKNYLQQTGQLPAGNKIIK
jgi:RHS repeat-associated protein